MPLHILLSLSKTTRQRADMVRVCVEYVWIGGAPSGSVEPNMRSKTRVLDVEDADLLLTPANIPVWNYDGSSTNQATTEKSEVALLAVFVCPDPFRGAPHVIALCETSVQDSRRAAASLFTRFNMARDHPWFGLEQEYVLLAKDGDAFSLLHWHGKEVQKSTDHYCGVGGKHAWGRDIADEHLRVCLLAGLTMSGINAEVTQAQWEFQVGPVAGVRAGDELWMARYLLLRVAEAKGAHVSFHPKPVAGFNGSGCHANVSFSQTRTTLSEAHAVTHRFLSALAQDHPRLMSTADYGALNEARLIGTCETSSMAQFSSGVGDRTASVRVPTHFTGYVEDRRPAANADPYVVTAYLYSRFLAAQQQHAETCA